MFDWLGRFWGWFWPLYLEFHIVIARWVIPIALAIWGLLYLVNKLGQQFRECAGCRSVIPKKDAQCRFCGTERPPLDPDPAR